jgi:hypothetical protein
LEESSDNCFINKIIGNWVVEFSWAVNNCKGNSLVVSILKLAWMALSTSEQKWFAQIHKQKYRTEKTIYKTFGDIIYFGSRLARNLHGKILKRLCSWDVPPTAFK